MHWLKLIPAIASMLLPSISIPNAAANEKLTCGELLDFNFKPLGQNEPVNLCQQYSGKLIMVVNTASKCAFTPQYEGLETLYSRYKDQGFVVLGFPSNDFAGQEPGTESQIKEFCELTYGVNFPMFEKTHAEKSSAAPFYQKLASVAGEYPAWNFHKYLIGADGKLIASIKSYTKPDSDKVIKLIEENLPKTVTAK